MTHSPSQDLEGEDCESPLWLKRQTRVLSPMEHRDKGTQGRILRQIPINLNNIISGLVLRELPLFLQLRLVPWLRNHPPPAPLLTVGEIRDHPVSTACISVTQLSPTSTSSSLVSYSSQSVAWPDRVNTALLSPLHPGTASFLSSAHRGWSRRNEYNF